MGKDNRDMEIKERKFLIWLEEYLKQSLPRDVIDKTAFYAGHDEGYKDAVFDMQEKLDAAIEVVKFYAEKSNWGIAFPDECVSIEPLDQEKVYINEKYPSDLRGGKLARDFLKTRGKWKH